MLGSPGHSPRHLSSPSSSASPNPQNAMQVSNSSSIRTPVNPKKRPIVLDEDTYVAAIEKIIERDFFPDISKLRDRLDWLEAVKTGDPIQIRDAQLKIIERRGKRVKSSNPDWSTQTRNSTNPRKRKERYGHLLEGEKQDAKLIEDSKRDRITDGYGTSDQPPSTLEGWKYTARNLLMYHPSDRGEAPLTEEERSVRLKGLTKELNRSNTRFHGKKAENGYSFVRTPSPAPGVDESPFITWGEIEGTPLRLEPEDTPIDIGGSGRGASASPSVRTLSPAAQKFMRNAISKSSSSVDESLRASYRGASPGVGTPKSRSVSRFGRDGSISSRSPSVREDSNPPWKLDTFTMSYLELYMRQMINQFLGDSIVFSMVTNLQLLQHQVISRFWD
ncbi:hypothetical protein GH714_021726 [Hevea brasiliensis]|uniref:Nuclear protein Es2 n=1 Tax=Hevea brasiliensis TaxID=3981 RepID=A0A6A6KTR4_HEVBR|nr:hypothetical protein GH714_021726 [Hevea brasiliensis]